MPKEVLGITRRVFCRKLSVTMPNTGDTMCKSRMCARENDAPAARVGEAAGNGDVWRAVGVLKREKKAFEPSGLTCGKEKCTFFHLA